MPLNILLKIIIYYFLTVADIYSSTFFERTIISPANVDKTL